MNTELVSILLPTYNCAPYIKEAIDSILEQTYQNFELIVIDDCSTDATFEILETYKDPRMKLIRKPQQKGISDSLNIGISQSKGDFIARMDGDDISLPSRIEKQLNYLISRPEILVLGTAIHIIGKEKPEGVFTSFDSIKAQFLVNNPIAHPSVMMRASLFKTHNLTYDSFKEPAEDFNLWVDVLAIGKMENLEEALLLYRKHPQQATRTAASKSYEKGLQARLRVLKQIGIEGEAAQQAALVLSRKHVLQNFSELEMILSELEKIYHLNKIHSYFNEKILELVLRLCYIHYIKRSAAGSIGESLGMLKSLIASPIKLPLWYTLKQLGNKIYKTVVSETKDKH